MGLFVIVLGLLGMWFIGKSIWVSGQYYNSYQLLMPVWLILLGWSTLRKYDSE
ncbi:MAG: hypothetical protein NZ108_09385 [Bacteroidia bacterium]|nr:hypothetical protein [Bacteroidia bacterium]